MKRQKLRDTKTEVEEQGCGIMNGGGQLAWMKPSKKSYFPTHSGSQSELLSPAGLWEGWMAAVTFA
jgi:hypothetical protein